MPPSWSLPSAATRGLRAICSLLVSNGGSRWLAAVPLLIEYQAVMTRQEHLAASRLSVGDVDGLLDAVAAVAEPVRLNFLWRPVLSDADDDMVLETAVNGQAIAIVTFNRRHFVSVPKQFGIEVLSPAEIVKQLEKKS